MSLHSLLPVRRDLSVHTLLHNGRETLDAARRNYVADLLDGLRVASY